MKIEEPDSDSQLERGCLASPLQWAIHKILEDCCKLLGSCWSVALIDSLPLAASRSIKHSSEVLEIKLPVILCTNSRSKSRGLVTANSSFFLFFRLSWSLV